MDREQIGRLWESRFHKILEMQHGSFDFYRELSEKDELVGESPRLREILEEIMDDEERHHVINKQLIKLVSWRIKAEAEKKKKGMESDGSAAGQS